MSVFETREREKRGKKGREERKNEIGNEGGREG